LGQGNGQGAAGTAEGGTRIAHLLVQKEKGVTIGHRLLHLGRAPPYQSHDGLDHPRYSAMNNVHT
jgi:hypothetical protein